MSPQTRRQHCETYVLQMLMKYNVKEKSCGSKVGENSNSDVIEVVHYRCRKMPHRWSLIQAHAWTFIWKHVKPKTYQCFQGIIIMYWTILVVECDVGPPEFVGRDERAGDAAEVGRVPAQPPVNPLLLRNRETKGLYISVTDCGSQRRHVVVTQQKLI